MNEKIILFGGSFDPIHCGHIAVAHFCIDYLKAHQLIFIPAKRSPFKEYYPAPDEHRLKMIQLAILDEAKFSVSDCELKRPAPSYTIDTVKYFQQKFGSKAMLFWIIGEDMARDIYKWHQFDELMKLCCICFMKRPDCNAIDFDALSEHISADNIEKLKKYTIANPLINISSTNIREMLKKSQPPKGLVQDDVLEYIIKNELYSL